MAKGKKKNGGIKKYWQEKGKKQAIGAGIDLGAVVIGGALGAGIDGRNAFLVGLGTIVAGHLLGEKGRIVQSIGVGTATYGLATINPLGISSSQPVNGTGLAGVKERLLAFKDNLLHATFLDKLVNKKGSDQSKETEDNTIGSIDLSELDVFEEYGEQQAYLQALAEEQQKDTMILDEDEQYYENEEYQDHEDLEGFDEYEEYTPYEVIAPTVIDFNTM